MALWQVAFQGSWQGQQVRNIRTYQTTTDTPSHQGFANAIGALLVQRYEPIANTAFQYDSLHIRRLDVVAPGFDYVPAGWPCVGQDPLEPSPSFMAVAYKLRGTNPTYPQRGAIRLAGITEDQITNNIVAAAAQTAWQDLGNVFGASIADGVSDTWVPVLYTDKYPTPNPVAQVTLTLFVTTQRSRKQGAGS